MYKVNEIGFNSAICQALTFESKHKPVVLKKCTHSCYDACYFVFQGFSSLILCTAMSTCVTMSSVSDFQNLDLCVAYHCVAVTPLHPQVVASQ